MNNLNTNQEEYKSLLTYEKGNLLLEGKNLAEYANMHPESINSFTKYIEILLLNRKYDDYQIIKTQTHDSGEYRTFFELRAKTNIYEQLKETIFNFAYTCCSNVVEEDSDKYWIYKEWTLKKCITKSEFLWAEGNFIAILPSRVKDYNIRLAYGKKVNEQERVESYQQFLSATKTKPMTKILKRNNN